MNLQAQTIQQNDAIVALRPLMERRYQRLARLLDACCEGEVALWELDIARADLSAVLEVMLPRIVAEDDE